MWYQPCNVVCGEVVALHDLVRYVGHTFDSRLEDGLAFLIDVVFPIRDGLQRRWPQTTSSLLVEMYLASTVHSKDEVHDA
jgi:hypothetical protein